MVVSKKVLKKASDRNRVRRRIYSALREAKRAAIVFPRREALTTPLSIIIEDLKTV